MNETDPLTGQTSPRYHPLPQPDEIPERDREDAMGGYLMMFAAVASSLPLPIINLIAAVIYYYVNRKKSRFIHFHSLQSLLSQLPTTFMNWGLLYWGIMVWTSDNWTFDDYFKGYIFAVVIANLMYVVFSLIAAVRAKKGRMYYFLFFGKLSYDMVFSTSNTLVYKGERSVPTENKPPF
ncbi:MAG: DUF4870 domain-containing protein [Cryomorphaceae bacterium]